MKSTNFLDYTKQILAVTALLFLSPFVFALNNDQPIRVGVTASLTGAYDVQGKSLLQGITMWANDINARGALLGRAVEIVHYDDQSSPEKSAELYEKLITVDKVDLLVGPYASNVTLAASKIAEKHQFPMVSGTSAATAIWDRGYKNIFQVDVPAPAYMEKGLEIAKNGGRKRVGIIYQDNLFTAEVALGAKQKAEALGLTVTVFESYPRTGADYQTLIKKFKDTDTEILLGASYFDDSVAIVREAKRQNYNPRALAFTSGPSTKDFGKELGEDAEGILGFTPWIRASRQPMAYDFNFRYRQIYKHAASSNSAGGYAAGQVLEAAARLAKSLDKDALREQLSTMSFLSLMGRYNVDETGKQIGKEMFLIQWQEGKRVLILPANIAEKKSQPMKPWDAR